jgi:hypothetical protein
MSLNPTVSEWSLVSEQFAALMREPCDSIEDILDVQFRKRFSELINQTAARQNWVKSESVAGGS